MELFVKATLHNREAKKKPREYIQEYSKFNIDCIVCSYSTGTVGGECIFATYNLCLKGSKENVTDFVVYLQTQGFKVYKNAV